MKIRISLAILSATVAALWPLPATYTNGSSALWIDNDVLMIYSSPSIVSNQSASCFAPVADNIRAVSL